VVGVAISIALPLSHKLVDGIVGLVATGFAVVVFGAVAFFLDDSDVRAVLARLWQVATELRFATVLRQFNVRITSGDRPSR
jgi:hypothetical protein